jgi:uncharacterized protein (TIGR03435 family)
MRFGPASLQIESLSLRDLIAVAFDTRTDRVKGPPWLEQVFLDVEAKSESPVSETAMRTMLRGLLEERMGLKAHTQELETNVYILSLDGKGVRLRKSDGLVLEPFRSRRLADRITLESDAMSIERLCVLLNSELDLPVLDRTGLGPSLYVVKITITNEDLNANLRAQMARKGSSAPNSDGQPVTSFLMK